MVRVENSILIQAKLEDVFQVAVDVEKYPEFIPSYKEVKILATEDNKMIVKRTGLVRGKRVEWKSEVIVQQNKSIQAVQLEGPLRGMKINWWFEERDGATTITLTHEFEYPIPFIGQLIGRWIVAKMISQMAQDTLAGIKKRIESPK